MPPVFKALASIAVWVLIIIGCIATIMSPITRIVLGEVFTSLMAWAIGVACLILSVCVIKLRQMLH